MAANLDIHDLFGTSVSYTHGAVPAGTNVDPTNNGESLSLSGFRGWAEMGGRDGGDHEDLIFPDGLPVFDQVELPGLSLPFDLNQGTGGWDSLNGIFMSSSTDDFWAPFSSPPQ